nr:HNH endonuclease [Falsiroseomonas tokyonensis]
MFQRVVQNDKLWTGPSSGRLGSRSDGGYVVTHGFAHEDWNFRRDVCADGHIYGYMYYEPKQPEGDFNIAFAAYDKGIGWHLAGFYEQASFAVNGANFPLALVRQRAKELDELDALGHIGGAYKGQSVIQKAKLLSDELKMYRWRVRPENIKPLQVRVAVPSEIIGGPGKHYTRPTEIAPAQWDQLRLLAHDYENRLPEDDYSDGGNLEFPEGELIQKTHYRRERNKTLVKEAKAAFIRKHGRLFCEVCHFDFESYYGRMGSNFIEVHHNLRPMHTMDTATVSKISDLAMLCSNCHRIIHRERPWALVEDFRKKLLIAKRAKT